MKKAFILMSVMLVSVAAAFWQTALAQDTGMKIVDSAICENVVDRTPVNAGTSFPASVGRLFSFTKIGNISTAGHITHVWYYGGVERARVKLSVRPKAWRTSSSKKIQSHEIGKWRVVVLDSANNMIGQLDFKITAQ